MWSVREKKKKDVPLTSSTEQTEDTRPKTARRRPQDLRQADTQTRLMGSMLVHIRDRGDVGGQVGQTC